MVYWWCAGLVFMGIAGIIWIVGTEPGSAWVVQQLLQNRDQPVQLTNFRGRLIDGVAADSLQLTQAGTVLNLQGIEFRYALAGLFSRQLTIAQLKAEKVTIQLPSKNRGQKNNKVNIPEFTSPLTVTLKTLQIKLLEIQREGKPPVQIKHLQGTAHLQSGKLALDSLHIEYLDWMLEGKGAFEFKSPFPLSAQFSLSSQKASSSMVLKADGNLDRYQLTADAGSRKAGFPEADARLRGHGNLSAFNISSLTVHTLDGVLKARGKVNWKKTLTAELSVSGDKINPAVLQPDYPGSIGFGGHLSIDGKSLESQFEAQGILGDYPLHATADVRLNPSLLDVRTGRFSIGPNHIDVHGQLSPTSVVQLSYRIEAPDLSLISPDLKGRLMGEGQLDGAWDNLRVQSDLSGQNLVFRSHQLQGIQVNVRPTVMSGEYQIGLEAKGFKSGAAEFKKIVAQGRGSLAHQQLEYTLKGGPQGLESQAKLKGDFNRVTRVWRGNIDQFQVSAKGLPMYRQSKKTPLSISVERQSISGFCLQNSAEKFCLTADVDIKKDSDLKLKLISLPLKRLKPWFPKAAVFKDTLDVNVHAKRRNGVWQGDIKVALDPHNMLNAQLGYHPSDEAIKGQLTAEFNQLQWINLWTDQLASPKGTFTADLKVSGTLSQPQLLGTLRLDQGFMRIPVSGTEIKNIMLMVTLQPDRHARIKGVAASGEGTLNIAGKGAWQNKSDWMVNMDLVGENVEASNIPLAHVVISPALKFHATRELIFIGGTLNVPEAEIELGDIPVTAIHTSPDTVIIGQDNGQDHQSAGLPLDIAIALLLGDKVYLQGLGLDARLTGRLQVAQQTGKSIEGDGVFSVAEGTYKAYGQDLNIERGDIYFNGPITDPRLSVRAVREIKTAGIIAGLELTGTIGQPESRIFSIPSLPESDALSYLLTGKPLLSTGAGDSNFLLNAAASLGLKQSKGALDKIRSTTGLDTFAIKPGQDISQSTLVAGKYLTPKLYVEYSTKLFEESSVYALRYKISNKVQLEAESGDSNQAMDLIYQFESD